MASLTNCTQGVYDCDYGVGPDGSCADYDGRYSDISNIIWPVVLSGMVMCLNAFSLGANDAANAWGAAVGSDAISVGWAVVLCAIFDFLGAVTLGYGVSDTIQKGISEIENKNCWACGYCDSNMSLYSIGMFGAGLSASLFLFVCSLLEMPVSGTHAVVGAVIGMTAMGISFDCIDWSLDGGLGAIMLSWVASPLLAGVIAVIIFLPTQWLIFNSSHPRERALQSLPVFYSLVTALITFTIMTKSPAIKLEGLYAELVAAFVLLFMLAVTVLVINPYVRARLPSMKLRVAALDHSAVNITAGGRSIRRASSGNIVYTNINESSSGIISMFDSARQLVSGSKGVDALLSPSPNMLAPTGSIYSTDALPTATNEEDSVELIVCTSPRSDTIGESTASATTAEQGKSRRKILKTTVATTSASAPVPQDAVYLGDGDIEVSREDAMFCFRYLIVYGAALASFAHGANDTSNSTAPFSAVYSIYSNGIASCESLGSPIWVMAVAGLCSSAGIIVLGHKVIATIGKNITDLDYHKGFCASFAAVVTVVLGTLLNLPLSTTHCTIGGVIAVGLVSPNQPDIGSCIATNSISQSASSKDRGGLDDGIAVSAGGAPIALGGSSPADTEQVLPASIVPGESEAADMSHSSKHPITTAGQQSESNSTDSNRRRRDGGKSVSYAVVTKILASWFVTVPVAALLSALFLVMFQGSVK